MWGKRSTNLHSISGVTSPCQNPLITVRNSKTAVTSIQRIPAGISPQIERSVALSSWQTSRHLNQPNTYIVRFLYDSPIPMLRVIRVFAFRQRLGCRSRMDINKVDRSRYVLYKCNNKWVEIDATRFNYSRHVLRYSMLLSPRTSTGI